nr:hypothetical protein [Mycoplasma haemocanis]
MVIGALIHSNFSEPLLELEELSFNLEREETGCIVYTVKRDIYSGGAYGVKEILDAKGRNLFLASIDPSQKNFIKDVNDACAGENNKESVKSGNISKVYVYKRENGDWIYSKDLQHNWTGIKGMVNRSGRR